MEVYNIANNRITGFAELRTIGLDWTGGPPVGTIGLDWQVSGFAAVPPAGAMGSSDNSTAQLVQAMAGFGGGAGDSLNAAPLSADTSQQTFLTTPQHV
jgi:hypothetical protein